MKYQIIYADPPWEYKDKSKSHGGGAESHYSCMTISELCALPIHTIADDNAVLLSWVTMPMLEVSFEVIRGWGFNYKTCAFTWIKVSDRNVPLMGMGRYTRGNPELLLLSTRGNGISRLNKSLRNDQYFPRREHSRKPAEFRDLIVKLFGDIPRIELFARRKVEGWDCIGYDIDGVDICEALNRITQE